MKKILIILMVTFSLVVNANMALSDNTHSVKLEKTNSQYLSILNASQTGLDITGDLTIEFKVKTSAVGERGYIVFYDSANGSGGYGILTGAGASSGKIKFFSNNSFSVQNNTAFNDGQWHHVAVTLSGTSVQFYVDGSADGTGFVSGAPKTWTGGRSIGANNTGQSLFVDALMDEVRIWNVVRTQQEISANYQTELVGNEAGLVGYWKFNGNLTDSSGNGNTLTNNGGAVFSTNVPFTGTTPPPPPPASCSIQGNVIGITSMPDLNGNGFPETVTLGVDSSNTPTACITDVNTEEIINAVKFFSSGWIPKSVFITPDMSTPTDGVGDISVMSTNASQTKIQIRDTISGSLIKEITLP